MGNWEGQDLRRRQGHPLLCGEVYSGHWHEGLCMEQACGVCGLVRPVWVASESHSAWAHGSQGRKQGLSSGTQTMLNSGLQDSSMGECTKGKGIRTR